MSSLKLYALSGALFSAKRFNKGVYETIYSLCKNADKYNLTASQKKDLEDARDKLYDVQILIENLHVEVGKKID